MVSKRLIDKYYLYYKSDTLLMKEEIKKHLKKDMILLDAGAGSGEKFDLSFIKNNAKKIIGVDLGDSIYKNNQIDLKIKSDLSKIPLNDNSVDIIISRYVFEHISNPNEVINEFFRILKKGGKVIILTPNKYHYVPFLGKITPHIFHEWVNKKRGRNEVDTFPTFYKCNTSKKIKKYCENAGFKTEKIILHEGEPNYLMWNRLTFYSGLLYERFVNSHNVFSLLRCTILCVFAK